MPTLCLVLLALALAACAPRRPPNAPAARVAKAAPGAAKAVPGEGASSGGQARAGEGAAGGQARAAGEGASGGGQARASTPAGPTAQGGAEEKEAELPAGFVRVPQTAEMGPVACGRFRVENLFDDPRVFLPRVVVRDEAGHSVYQARGRRWGGGPGEPAFTMALWVEFCGDLTGDGVPEIVMTESSLGAHCCYTHYVVSLTAPTKRLMMWEKGDGGGGLWPEKLKPGPAWQLTHTQLVWPPFDVDAGDPPLSYAGVPGFPIVFDFVGGAYVPRTFLFQDALRRKRREGEEVCARNPADCEGFELVDWGWALLLGDWDAKKATIVKDDELRRVLDRRAAAMKARLRAQLGP